MAGRVGKVDDEPCGRCPRHVQQRLQPSGNVLRHVAAALGMAVVVEKRTELLHALFRALDKVEDFHLLGDR
eukprot:2183279-Prymnesium_polylepis.1